MNDEDVRRIRNGVTKGPKSVWGYLPFLIPALIVPIGVCLHAAMLWSFESRAFEVEVLLRQGDRVEVMFDSLLVTRLVLTASACFILSFVLLAMLAVGAVRQEALLRKAAQELGIVD